MNVPRVDLAGSPYEIGFQHGSKLNAQIHSQLTIYRHIFQKLSGLSWDRVIDFARAFQPTIQRLAPELYEEIEGISAGSGAPLIDIVALNARSEIALGTLDDGCTSLSWSMPGGTDADGPRQILAQNWDWTESVGKNLAMVSITRPGKPNIWMVVEPGIVGKIGFNSASVGVCLNAIRARAVSTSLLPVHLLLRIALECSSVSQAISEVERLGGPASCQHILIADSSLQSRGMEISPRGNVYLNPDADGVLVHSNHFIRNRLVEEVPWGIGSEPRLKRINELVRRLRDQHSKASTITPRVLRENIFSDKQGAPTSICCHVVNKESMNAVTSTLFNIVMEFAPGKTPRVEVQFGRPGDPNASGIYQLP